MYGSFRDVIKKWPGGPGGCAEDAQTDINRVYSWISRDNIPPAYWKSLVAGATARGFLGVTLDLLAELAAQKRSDGNFAHVNHSDA